MNQKGQTLIEVVIAVVLLSVVIVALFQALSVGIWGTYTTDQLTTAQQIARSEMEYIKFQNYDEEAPYEYDLIALNGTPITALPSVEYNISGFAVHYSVDPVDLIDPEVLQQITMTVNYPGGRPLQVVAYKANIAYGEPGKRTEIVDVPDSLDPEKGYYYLVNTEAEGEIVGATWGVDKGSVMVYIYIGTPSDLGLGPGSDGLSNTPADDEGLADSVVGSGEGSPLVFVVTDGSVPAGLYTVYYYNPSTKQAVDTEMATVTYAVQ